MSLLALRVSGWLFHEANAFFVLLSYLLLPLKAGLTATDNLFEVVVAGDGNFLTTLAEAGGLLTSTAAAAAAVPCYNGYCVKLILLTSTLLRLPSCREEALPPVAYISEVSGGGDLRDKVLS